MSEKPAQETAVDTEKAPENAAPGKVLSAEAKRALAEAAERRAAQPSEQELPPEVDGRDGPEPTRYGDWERKGSISDF